LLSENWPIAVIGNRKVYRLREDDFDSTNRVVRKRMLRKGFILLLWVFTFGAGFLDLLMAIQKGTPAEKKLLLWVTLMIAVPAFLFAFVFSAIQAFKLVGKALRQRWDSYELILTAGSIICRVTGAIEIEIHREEIISIQEIVSVVILSELQIKTAQNHIFINIPASLEGYEEVKSYLANGQEIELHS
jgi:hypothetical protein